jgi:hypothetical protein
MTSKVDDFLVAGGDLRAAPRLAVTPTLADEALYGLAGRIVRALAPYTEADPVAILAHLLVGLGNLVGRGPHALVESTEHPCGEFAVLVGPTSKGRKGQAWSTPRKLLREADPSWTTRIKTGLSSGEGVIYNVRDARWGYDKKGNRVLEDEGESDKRLFVIEPELAIVLRRMNGEANSLSGVLRDSFDTGDLSTLTKNSPLRASGAHVSIVAHTTQDELVTELTEVERANGFANRFLYLSVQRSRVLPEPAPVPDTLLDPFVSDMRAVVDWAKSPRVIARDPDAKRIWAGVYPTLSEGEPGLIGAVLARAEAHALRLSVLYAVLDRSPVVRPEHLHAALALWGYADASARKIFGERLGLAVADTILAALKKRDELTSTDLMHLFDRHKSADEIKATLDLLKDAGRITFRQEATGGRPATYWRLAKKAKEAKEGPDDGA